MNTKITDYSATVPLVELQGIAFGSVTLSIGFGVVATGAIILDGFLVTDIVRQRARTQKVAEENNNMVKSWL
jgi:hypothetical protein